MGRAQATEPDEKGQLLLNLRAKGYTHKEIAAQLGITSAAYTARVERLRNIMAVATDDQMMYEWGKRRVTHDQLIALLTKLIRELQ